LRREPAERGRVDHQKRLAAPLRQRQLAALDGFEFVIESAGRLGLCGDVCHSQHDGASKRGEQRPHIWFLSLE
jgi:hypothetical protein